ncbi:hypothetical protein PFMG_04311 [Plasmodium falciparum IGH-CR14]|uniref:Dynein intermediate chain n=1 Tax=Plasmodium falciparum IGH-CR14 TaxID=580059 RepID=A0A0L1IG99_PLAFA|nr:hypothetical protein PFMG_04311 [Plasmodium falciparum IGH-CR14]
MKNKNILHTDKKDKYIEPKENIKKKKEEIKKNEITKKHEINKKKLDIDTKNKTDSDYKNKRDKEGVENKYVSNEIKYKTTDTDKKNNQLKNSILFDVHITNKDVETKGDTKISQTDIDKDVKHMLEINLSKELSDIIFNKSSSVLINKNYFFTLVQKFFKSDEYLSIKKSLTDYTFDDILMLQNVDTNKHSIVFDTNTYSYILEVPFLLGKYHHITKRTRQNLQSSDILSFKNIKYLNKIFIYTDVKYTTDKVVLFTLYLSLINYLIFIIYINNYKNDNFIEGVNTDSYILIWSYNNYINPLYALISPYLVIWKLPPNFNGISVLNSKIKERTVIIARYLVSSLDHSHKREVTSLIFFNDKSLILNEKKISISNQKNCHLLVSISVDGSILIWDATNIEIAETKINMKKKDKELADELYDELYGYKPLFKNNKYSLGYTYFHFTELNGNVSSFFAFSEEGEYIVGNLYGCMQKDKNYSIINKINDDYKSFKTLVCVKRNTLIKYLIITLTDTNFYLWKENEEHPIFISPKSNEIYSCCEFSQTKISVIFIGKINGHIEIWNLSEQKNHCIYSLTISSYSLTCVSIFQNIDSNIFNSYVHKTKEEKKNKDDNDDINYDDYDDIIDTNEYLMSKDDGG